MRSILALVISGTLATAAMGADLVITSLTGNGQLTWTNTITNASYRVEWAPSLTGPWNGFGALTNLESIKATNTTVTVAVPMFYRVVWTDPPPPRPFGVWDFNGYSFEGSLVVTGQISLTNFIGSWSFEAVPNGTNTWWLQCSSGGAGFSLSGFSLSVSLAGCYLAEGAYYLTGTLVGDTYSGTWCSEGIVCSPIGTFIARRRSG